MKIEDLFKQYAKRKQGIRARLREFRSILDAGEEDVFAELCFCICTPQSNAVLADRAISRLKKSGRLYDGTFDEMRPGMSGVRFPNNKTRFLLEARQLFIEDGKIGIKKHINARDVFSTRQWFYEHVKGLGLKESSHFLRNIGLGSSLAILDVHILRRMVAFNVIKEVPKTLSVKTYFDLEKKLAHFCSSIGIPMDELDLLFWSDATGFIFK
ncbi:MAG: DNA lyase [Candidatus Omnitrophica bacterium]|nr:DNA lyase [Candidatus Omnitrophota bacterium]